MFTDLGSIMWKEWIEWKRQYGSRTSMLVIMAVMVLIFALILPLQFGKGWFQSGQALYAWLLVPVLILFRSMGDVISGERERHTLETLLATRLPDSAIIFGKMLVPAITSWLLTQIIMIIAVIPLNLFTQIDTGFYSVSLLVSGLFLSLLSSLYAAAAGLFLSIRSETSDQANQSMFLFLILYVVLLGVVTGVYHVISPGSGMSQMVLGIGLFFCVVDFLILSLARKSFKRKRMLFR